MWPLRGQGLRTYYYDNFPNVLDQFWVSKGIVAGRSGFGVEKESVKLEMFEQIMSPGDYPIPIRFGRPSKQVNLDGFSDHYPVAMRLREDD